MQNTKKPDEKKKKGGGGKDGIQEVVVNTAVPLGIVSQTTPSDSQQLLAHCHRHNNKLTFQGRLHSRGLPPVAREQDKFPHLTKDLQALHVSVLSGVEFVDHMSPGRVREVGQSRRQLSCGGYVRECS